jgi:hypothetical protein
MMNDEWLHIHHSPFTIHHFFIMKRYFSKLMVLSLVANKATYFLPSGVVPNDAKVVSIKTRKTGKTQGERTLESNIDGLVLGLKRFGTDVDFEIPLTSVYNQTVNGDCTGYVLPEPVAFNFGETGSELRSYDSAAVTTGKVVELEIGYFIG